MSIDTRKAPVVMKTTGDVLLKKAKLATQQDSSILNLDLVE